MDSGSLVTPAQAARELHVSTDTLRRWADDGKLTALRTIGGHRRYNRTELAKLLSEQRLLFGSYYEGGIDS
jgi:excisionase family DNA binding protein